MPSIPILLGNIGFIVALLAILFKDILYLRVFAVIGSLLVYPMYMFAYDEVLWTNFGWTGAAVAINIVQIIILVRDRRPLVLEGLEKEIHDSIFYALTTRTFNKIYKLAKIEEYTNNTILFHSNESIHNLYLIINGQIEVTLQDDTKKIVSNNTFIGEQAFITSKTASATIRILSEKAILLKWDNIALHDVLDKDVALSNTFDLILTTDIIQKLRRMGT